jgi:rod shape determining protein RodA
MIRGFREEFWRHFDFSLFGAVILAISFGVAMIRSAIAGNEILAGLVQRQIIFAILGFVVIMIVAIIDYHYWSALIRQIYFVIMVFLIILFIIGGQRFGAARWLETGIVSIQPTEIAKIVVILALSYYFGRNIDSLHDLPWLVKGLIIAFGLAIWIFLQPNLSNVIVIMVIWGSLAWLGGLELKQLGILILIGLTVAIIGFQFLKPYQQERVTGFIFSNIGSSSDITTTYGPQYNVDQALIALGSGGLFGKGYGLGTQTQLRFLKVRHTDFIFSVIAEEFGLVGAVFVLLIMAFIIYRCLRAASKANDPFGAFICYGVAILIFFQAAVNIAVNLNLIPVTGLPLPFISYGGSGLLSLMLGIGLVESVVMRQKAMDF